MNSGDQRLKGYQYSRRCVLKVSGEDAMNKPQAPVVGDVIERDTIKNWASNPRGFVNWLRAETLGLADKKS